MRPLCLVVAMTRDRAIGLGGDLPWRIPEDLRHFKRLTTGHAVVMGRRTHESIGRPLPRRRNVVVTRRAGARFEGCEVAPGLEAALELAWSGDPCPFVIGGAAVYEAALPFVTRMHVTWVDRDVEADTFFPAFDAGEFVEVERREAASASDVSFVTLVRRGESAGGCA